MALGVCSLLLWRRWRVLLAVWAELGERALRGPARPNSAHLSLAATSESVEFGVRGAVRVARRLVLRACSRVLGAWCGVLGAG